MLFLTTKKSSSASQGVGLPYISWLRSIIPPSLSRITTSQFCQMFIRPRTWRSCNSLVSELQAADDTAKHVGHATWFVSHTWANCIVDTLDAVLLFFDRRADCAAANLWVDFLVTPQQSNTPSPPSSWFMSTFKQSIAAIGGLLLVVDAWDNPSALQRAW